VPVQKFPRHSTAEVLYLLDFSVDSLLEDLIDNLEIPGQVRTFEASGEIDKDIECRDEYDRTPLRAGNFNKFLDIFHADTGKVDPDIRRCCLDVRKFTGERMCQVIGRIGLGNG